LRLLLLLLEEDEDAELEEEEEEDPSRALCRVAVTSFQKVVVNF
jgi:hypothetical protein